MIPTQAEPIDTPFVSAVSSFERISDDEERAMNGEMFKDARLQERIMDEVHAVGVRYGRCAERSGWLVC